MFGFLVNGKLQGIVDRLDEMLNKKGKETLDEIEVLIADKGGLERQIVSLKKEAAELKLKNKHDEEDIAHLIKIKEGQQELAFQKKELEMEKTKQDEINVLAKGYRAEVEKMLKEETKKMKDMYSEVLQRLPDVNVMLGDRGKEQEKKGD